MASAVIGALRVNLGIDTAAFSDGLKKAQGKLQNFGAMVQKGLVAGAAAAGAALTGLGFAVRNTINAADDMAKSAQRFGIPIEELSRLKYAADLSGVSFNELGTGVRRLSQNMNDAAQGIGEGAKAFEQLGISVTNSDGTLKSTSEVMAEIADRFAAMPDGAEPSMRPRHLCLGCPIIRKQNIRLVPEQMLHRCGQTRGIEQRHHLIAPGLEEAPINLVICDADVRRSKRSAIGPRAVLVAEADDLIGAKPFAFKAQNRLNVTNAVAAGKTHALAKQGQLVANRSVEIEKGRD